MVAVSAAVRWFVRKIRSFAHNHLSAATRGRKRFGNDRSLAAMDERMLRDIGLARHDAINPEGSLSRVNRPSLRRISEGSSMLVASHCDVKTDVDVVEAATSLFAHRAYYGQDV